MKTTADQLRSVASSDVADTSVSSMDSDVFISGSTLTDATGAHSSCANHSGGNNPAASAPADPPPRARPSACVFVASLCSWQSDEMLAVSVTKCFAQWGHLTGVKVLRDTCNRPYAFVQYGTNAECDLAVKRGHNYQLGERRIRCEYARVNRTIFVTTATILDETQVRESLAAFGEVEALASSNSLGLVFNESCEKRSSHWLCKFAYREDAILAYASLPNDTFVRADWARNIEKGDLRYARVDNGGTRTTGPRTKKEFCIDRFSVYVSPLRLQCREREVLDRFMAHGRIAKLEMATKRDSCYAFIRYESDASAARAVEQENHSQFQDRTLHVRYREVDHSPGAAYDSGIVLAPAPIAKRATADISGERGADSYYSGDEPGARSFSGKSYGRYPGGYRPEYRARTKSQYQDWPFPVILQGSEKKENGQPLSSAAIGVSLERVRNASHVDHGARAEAEEARSDDETPGESAGNHTLANVSETQSAKAVSPRSPSAHAKKFNLQAPTFQYYTYFPPMHQAQHEYASPGSASGYYHPQYYPMPPYEMPPVNSVQYPMSQYPYYYPSGSSYNH